MATPDISTSMSDHKPTSAFTEDGVFKLTTSQSEQQCKADMVYKLLGFNLRAKILAAV
jgi:hypothetical protein